MSVVLVNSNPATIMTDEEIADAVYIEPLTIDVLTRIIAQERPDGLLPTLGGQTGLNLAVELHDAGVLDRYDVRLLGTSIQTIKTAEDRELFRDLLRDLGEPVAESAIVSSLDEAIAVGRSLGLPLVVRPAYTLGGTGGGFATTLDELRQVSASGLAASPIHQILVERSVRGWREIEYEMMRDSADTCITICNMENLDAMGVHTGDSIVVAPSQTLSDKEYQMLRSASTRIIRALGIEGGCNIQFGLSPNPVVGDVLPGGAPEPMQYVVIEVNPRVSRSSALASKATGYPIARVAAKIAVGRRLDEIPNEVTQQTKAAFEPALDYCVVKIPRWPFDKFGAGDRTIGDADEGDGRSHGHRPKLRGCAAEGRPVPRDQRPLASCGRTPNGRAATSTACPSRRPTCVCGQSPLPCAGAPMCSRWRASRLSTPGSSTHSPASSRWSAVSHRSQPPATSCGTRSASACPMRQSQRSSPGRRTRCAVCG